MYIYIYICIYIYIYQLQANRMGKRRRGELAQPSKLFSILFAYINIRGQMNKLEDIDCMMDQVASKKHRWPAVLAVAETWENAEDKCAHSSSLELKYEWYGKPSPTQPLVGRPAGGGRVLDTQIIDTKLHKNRTERFPRGSAMVTNEHKTGGYLCCGGLPPTNKPGEKRQ